MSGSSWWDFERSLQPRRLGKSWAAAQLAENVEVVGVNSADAFSKGCEVLIDDERYAVEWVDTARSTLGLKLVTVERGTGKMKSTKQAIAGAILAALGTEPQVKPRRERGTLQKLLNWASPPADTEERMYGGRYGRKHSTRNKVGSHKQTMRKLGKL
jgi:hypothetical protein